jgi:hypothetical protein
LSTDSDYALAEDRLAFIDGDSDRSSCPLFYLALSSSGIARYFLLHWRLILRRVHSSPGNFTSAWRPATPNSPHAPRRADTILRPNKIIPDGTLPLKTNDLAFFGRLADDAGLRCFRSLFPFFPAHLAFFLAVHHFDENGLSDPSQEPKRIRAVHEEQVVFVRAWLKMKSDWEM